MKSLNVLMKTLLLLFISCFAWNTLSAEPNTVIKGKVRNLKLVNFIELEVNDRYLDNKSDIYYSNVLEDGTFAFAIEIKEPQLVQIYYSRNSSVIYLEPNDELEIEFDADTFNHSFTFSGRSGQNNTYLHKYLKKYPKEKDAFKYLRYRINSYWYVVSPKQDEWMRTLTKDAYFKKMALRLQEPLAQLEFYNKNHPDHLTANFVDFLKTEINYDWAYHMMLFGNVYKGIHSLDESFFEFTKEVPLQNDQIGNEWYRKYLMAYSNHTHMKEEDKGTTPYSGQYVIAEKYLSGKPLAFIQSEMIAMGFSKNYINETLPHYQHFLTHNPYIQFDDKIVSAHQKVMRTAIGSPAPEFTLGKKGDTEIKLSDLRGKVVFLNFWASWCRPCIKKMDEMKALQKEMEAQGILFIHVSFDRKNETWEKTLNQKQYDGIHVIVPGSIESDIAKQYEVRAIPQYFIIDKEGRFAEKPPIFSVETVKDALLLVNK